MKKNILIAFGFSLCVITYSCTQNNNETSASSHIQDSSKKKQSVATTPFELIKDTLDDCDYFVPQTTADTMFKKYETDFHQPGLTKEFWIEKCALEAMKKFLDDNHGEYDGFRFFLGKEKKIFNPKSVLIIVPTKETVSPTNTDRHTNCFGIDIPIPSCNVSQLQFNLPVTEARNKINLFGKDFRKESLEGQRKPAGVEELSIGLWMSRCKIDKILSLYTPANNLDGLLAKCAAYFRDDERRQIGEREFIVQSTFIFVPTRNRKPAWEVVPKPPEKWTRDAGFNHGELCPQVCN